MASVQGEPAARPLGAAGLLQLQRSAGNEAATALVTVQRQPKPAAPVEQAGALLRGFETWVGEEKTRQHAVDTSAVIGLDPKQASNVKDAAGKLAAAIPTLSKAGQALDPTVGALREARTNAEKAQAALRSRDQADRLEGQHWTNVAAEAVTQARGHIGKVGAGFDVSVPTKNLKIIADALAQGGSLSDIVKSIKTTIDDLSALARAAKTKADSAHRIEIMLRAFIALNDPGFRAAPTAAELNSVKSLLAGGLGDEFVAVFGTAADYELLTEFANTLGAQIAAREGMAKATGKAAPRTPSQGDAQAYFASLAGLGNDEVFFAYTEFARAYFYHRGLASVSDLLLDMSDLFAAKVSITGQRGLVCTGFANIGALAMAAAGAKLTGFSVAVHASDDMIRHDRLDEQGHAIARMTRRGVAFSVSNQRIEPVANSLVGKGAVPFGNAKNPLFVGEGATTQEATNAMLKKIAARKRRL